MLLRKLLLVAGFLTILMSCGPDLPDDIQTAYDELPKKLDYNQDVKPVLSDKCFACHGPDKSKQKAGLRLDVKEVAYAELPENKGKVAIDPGSLANSEFYHRIMSSDPEYMMPTPASHLNLTPKEKAVLIKWIEDGAEYKPHWAFVKPEKPEIPETSDKWVQNPIDNFVLEKLEKEKLAPSPEANKELLLRRLSLDLTGLPPTPAETDAFLADKAPNAYEKQVNRLLASPHYGEKMAVDWLDLARFADSHGYTVDRLRDMSPYRDWVINAFNKNMHYDQFVHWQLAGDLMPKPTKDMMIATAFNRNHQQNMEGGVIEEEFQTEYVVDRTNTFGDAMLGLSVGCAKCHDHKFDPISQKNYYELFSFFNNVKEAGQISWNDALPTPTLMLPTDQQSKTLDYINSQIKTQEQQLSNVATADQKGFDEWVKRGLYQRLAKEDIPQNGLQAKYSLDNQSLKNSKAPSETGVMKRDAGQAGESPVFTKTESGTGLLLDGDTFLDLGKTGVFRKSEPFSIGIRINAPTDLKEGVILHKSQAERLYNFRGYHLYLKDNKLELNMAHTSPSDAITKVSIQDIPKEKWIQITITYDGTSAAKGLKLFLDGKELAMQTTMDHLTKDILFNRGEEPGLQIGGWWRGLGFKNGKVDDIIVYNRTLTPFEIKILAGQESWSSAIAKMRPVDVANLKAYYDAAVSPTALSERQKLVALRSQLSDSTENIKEIMVMRESPIRKKSHILLRGNYDSFGAEVFPNTPESVLPFPKNLPKNRYGLALWLTDKNNPLTARVAVNRFWQNFFGTGIVKTTEDFGNQGEMPSHLELLDWLAISFQESGWDVKKLNKLIVMSATYRQSSRGNPKSIEKDPENRWLSHGPANRMSAEMIRDNALFASGLLNKAVGGKSIKPYQPEGLWEINSATYTPDSGDAIYRRSLYILAKRTVPNPTLSTFDGTSRSFCVVRRQRTNTPLQALVTLNDPTFNEAMKVLGEQMARISDKKTAITTAYRKLTGRTPEKKEIDLLEKLQTIEYQKFKTNPEKSKGWISEGQYKTDPKLDKALIAANAVVSSTILNSDATLTKR